MCKKCNRVLNKGPRPSGHQQNSFLCYWNRNATQLRLHRPH